MGLVQSNRWKVLLVEDDAELRLLTKTMLEESELEIIECESGEAALATMLLQGQNVAMIFADIHLSGLLKMMLPSARAAGVQVKIDGADLLLKASAPPPASVLWALAA